MKEGIMHNFICQECGAHASVPFNPRPGSKLLCPTCFQKSKNQNSYQQRSPHKNQKQLFPIVCSHCGAHDNISFQPRLNSKVLCSVCNSNQDIVSQVKRTKHHIICHRCGVPSHVPFVPDPGSRVYCRACLNDIQDSKQSGFSPKRSRDWKPPGVSHKTQVRFNVLCSECGKKDVLPFVPKTKGPMLCSACADSKLGNRWRGSRFKEKPREYPFNCVQCSHKDYVPFEPKPDHDLLCDRCRNEQAIPDRSRIKGAQRQNPFVSVRKK